jgi:hypothetical protein
MHLCSPQVHTLSLRTPEFCARAVFYNENLPATSIRIAADTLGGRRVGLALISQAGFGLAGFHPRPSDRAKKTTRPGEKSRWAPET